MSEPAATAPPAVDPEVADGGAEDEKDVIGADGKKISKTQLKKQAKLEEQAKKKAERLKKVEEEKVSFCHSTTVRGAQCVAASH